MYIGSILPFIGQSELSSVTFQAKATVEPAITLENNLGWGTSL